jgi:acylphosphatase
MTENRELASLQATVHGYVQGVFFRAFVSQRADELGLSGYARNLPTGAVEVVAEGERKKLERLINHLKAGPPSAKVEKVVTSWSKYTGNYTGFGVRY